MKKMDITLIWLLLVAGASMLYAGERPVDSHTHTESGYEWTTDHMQVGVRWQPFGRPGNDAYDAQRPVIAEDSSYVQFWVSWAATEPTEAHTDYVDHPSDYLRSIEAAVDACVAQNLKVELVFWHCPAWASVSGESGGWRPKVDQYPAFATRMATHFKGRVNAYQLYHEANMASMMQDGDIEVLIEEVFKKGAKAIRQVYAAAPAEPVIISTSGASPCDACPELEGLEGHGGVAANDYYERLVSDPELMNLVDALNLNVSDHFNGYGEMDGSYISSVWGNYDLIRSKLDAHGYTDKDILASESWIVWDDAANAVDVNGDGIKNEQDAYSKALTIIGQCMQRGLNTVNLPWSDNSSGWAMGLTKRRDYNGRIKELRPDIVIPARDGGADIVTRKVSLRGDDAFTLQDGSLQVFTIEDYINPPDPNHLHYYIWKWYAQIAGGPDEVIRHAVAGEIGNDVVVWGPGFTGNETYRLSSFNRTRQQFTVLVYASGANGKIWSKVRIPSTIQTGRYYNNDSSKLDFRGEGFAEGESYCARIETKDISTVDGSDVNPVVQTTPVMTVSNQTLEVAVHNMNKFTTIEFTKVRK